MELSFLDVFSGLELTIQDNRRRRKTESVTSSSSSSFKMLPRIEANTTPTGTKYLDLYHIIKEEALLVIFVFGDHTKRI